MEHPFHCDCLAVPNLWSRFDLGDVAALVAPRPLHIETGSRDPLNGRRGLANVRPQVAGARRCHRAMGAREVMQVLTDTGYFSEAAVAAVESDGG